MSMELILPVFLTRRAPPGAPPGTAIPPFKGKADQIKQFQLQHSN